MTPDEPHDPQVLTAELDGRPFTYTDEGEDGPPLVLIHGLPGSVRDFRWLGAALRTRCPGRRVVRLDLPGFGGTDIALGGKMTIEQRAAYVVAAVRALDLGPVVLVAHSMGGPVALAAATLMPEATRELVLLASVGLTPHRGYRSVPNPRFTAPVVTSWLGRRFLAKRLHRAFVKGGFPASSSTDELFLTLRIVGKVRFKTIRGRAEAFAKQGTPAHVLAAADDPIVESAIGEALRDALGASGRLFEDGGHNIQKSRAVEIAELLIAAQN